MPINLLAGSGGMQNVYAPLPFTAHLIFCVLATLLYAVLFNRRGKRHYLILMIAIDMTLMTQFWTQEVVVFFIGFAEVIMLILAGILAYRSAKEEKAREEALKIQREIEEMDRMERKRSEKLFVRQEYINKNFVDNAFDDEDDD